MFSKELLELDKNTVEYMIDEMQNEINRKDALLEQKDRLMHRTKQLYTSLVKDG